MVFGNIWFYLVYKIPFFTVPFVKGFKRRITTENVKAKLPLRLISSTYFSVSSEFSSQFSRLPCPSSCSCPFYPFWQKSIGIRQFYWKNSEFEIFLQTLLFTNTCVDCYCFQFSNILLRALGWLISTKMYRFIIQRQIIFSLKPFKKRNFRFVNLYQSGSNFCMIFSCS